MDRWRVATTDDFDAWFANLEPGAQVEVIAKVELLKVLGPLLRRPHLGPLLRRPHADTLKGSRHGNMKELRADTADAVMRVAFAFDPTRSAILLCAGNKAGVSERRFYRQLIERADKLYDAHLAKLKAQKKPRGSELWPSHSTNS